jgi:hypothetical protein
MKSLIKAFLVATFFSGIVCCNAQQDSAKLHVIKFLINMGELDKIDDISKYRDNVYIVDLIDPTGKNEHSNIYKVGTFASHSRAYLMFKKCDEYEIFEINPLDIVLLQTLDFLDEQKIPPPERIECIKSIISLFQRNQKAIPWTG